MKKPTDNQRLPARRFSAMRPPVRRLAAARAADPIPDQHHELSGTLDEEPVAVVAPASPAATTPPDPVPAVPRLLVPEPIGNGARTGDEARVAKVMSRAGLCSRREAEAWIKAGRVAVNGSVIDGPALNIGPSDQITVDGYSIDKPEHTRLFMFHKTRGLVTTARDPEGRPTIYDALPEDMPRLMTVGRLDINTEGLLLLTNDGGLARLLELPSTGWLRRYRVRANGRVDQTQLDSLARGVTVAGVDYAGIDAKLDRIQGANLWLTMGLREGKNREVKRVLEFLGLTVTRLIRISFGPFQLGDLGENAVEEVRTRVLRDQLGSSLAKQAGLYFPTEEVPTRPASPTIAQEPRRKTSRSSTADRKGRAVAVERIARTDRPNADREVSRRSAADRKQVQGPRAPAGRGEASDRRGGERPARTLRQADVGAVRRTDARPERAAGNGKRGAGEDRAERAGRSAGGSPRSEITRPKARTRDVERPRTGRNKDEPAWGRAPSRADARDRSGRPPGPGKPAFRGGDKRPDRPGRPPGGSGGRGRPRG